MGGRSRTASTAQWLVGGSVPAQGRRGGASASRSVAGIGLPVSPERPERRESSSASPAAPACPGPDSRAPSLGLSGLFRRLRLPTMRRAGGGRASAAIPGTGERAGAPARSARGLAAAVLLAFAAFLAVPSQAQAQSTIGLVSNIGQTMYPDGRIVGTLLDYHYSEAQRFTTGDNADGYTLAEVVVRIHSHANSADSPRVSIYTNSSGSPGTLLYTFTSPASFGTGEMTFTAPADATLEKETKYFVVFEETSDGIWYLGRTTWDDEDTARSGWSIADTHRWRNTNSGTWGSFDAALLINIKGFASTDATLSGLALEDRHGAPIGLTPATFSPNRSNYTAEVFNRTASAKLTATTTSSAATVVIENDDDSSTPKEAELGLAVGSNTLRVTVTAEDNSTTKTYRVVTTRGSPSTCVAPDLADRRQLWTGTLTIDVSSFFGVPVEHGFGADANWGSLSDSDFDFETNSYTIDRVSVGTGAIPTVIAEEELQFSLTGALTAEEKAKLSLHVCNAAFAFSNATYTNTSTTDQDHTYSWTGTGFDWAPITTRMLYLSVPLSTDATLNGLALKNAADNSAIDLNETFATGTKSYTADVLNAVTTITVKPKSDHNATFAYLNASDTVLTDADLNTTGFQAALAVGANTIKVKVTAEDGNTTDTYTVVVTRDHTPPPPPIATVPYGWSLTPSGLGVGDRFRLVFQSSTSRNASSTDIATYNSFVQNRAAAGHADIRAYSSQFRAIASTASVDARDNTATTGTGVPIYWLNGNKAADNYADLYDGTWDDEGNRKDENGNARSSAGSDAQAWTGSNDNGTEYFSGGISGALGSATPRYGQFNSSSGNPLSSTSVATNAGQLSMLGLSQVFIVPRVPPVREKVRFGSTGYHAIEGGAETTVAVSMYPRPIAQVDIPLTVTNLGSTTAADYQIFVNGSQVSPGSLSLTFSPDDIGSGGGGIAKRFTVRAVTDSANDHRDSVKFGFGTLPVSVLIEGETDGRAAKTATVWLLEPQTEMMDCSTPDASAPYLGNLRNTYNPRRLNSKGQIKNSGDCVWFKVRNLANNRSHQFLLTGRWVQTNDPGQPYTSVLSEITSPQIKIYNSDGTPLVQDGSAVEDQVLEADRRFRAPLIRFTPATAGTYYLRASSLGYDVGHFTISYVDIGPGTAPATAAEPLTATLEDTPSNHDGSSAFTFRIAFSADVEITPEDMRDHALTVAGGTVTNAARVDDRKDLWELTVDPAGTGAVTILVPLDRACTETGALCTAEGVALSTAPGHSVPGPAPVPQGQQAQAAPAPLAASFVSVPPEHDGETAFWLELGFDAAVEQGSKQHIRALLGVTGGSETRVRCKDGRLDHWRIKIQPSSHEAVTVTLSPSPACGATGAVCTEDGRTFTTALATRIQGPPGLAVADAEVQEAVNATLAFAVTLNRAPSSTVTVDYATSDGTAAAGSDYTATSGTLTFAAGETAKTVPVPVLDDDHDEGSETLTLTLSNPSGAYLADGSATGTITNTDHMPQAWIARFGRTVADQVLDAVEARLRAARTAGMSVSLGGQQIGGTTAKAKADGKSGAASDGTSASLSGATAADAGDTARLKALSDWLSRETEEKDRFGTGSSGWSRTLTGRELLMGSSFSLAAQTDDGGFAALWGRMAQTSFAGREGSLSLDGDVTTGLLGADYASGRWTTGLVLSHSIGEGGYRGETSGEIEATVTALTPWARYAVTERLSVWGAAGYGAGGLTLTAGDDPALKTDLGMMLAAAGVRGTLIGGDGPKLEAVTDARWVRTTTASVSSSASDGGNLASASATVTRLRLGLEGSWPFPLGDGALGKGAAVTPRLALGLRHDGGDAETGVGADIGGGVTLAAPAHGLTVSLEGRGVLTHEAAGFRDRGIAGSLSWNPRRSGRGPKLTLTQTVGAGASGGKDALLSRTTLEGLAANDNGNGRRRLEARFGYGFSVLGDRFTMTPEIGLGLSEAGRDTSLGWRLTRTGSGPGSLELSVEAQRCESANDNTPPEHGIGFRLTARF